MPYTLGVDLGTAFTAAAVWRDGRASTVPLADHSDAIPSAVFLRPDGVMLVGEAAVRRGVLEPDRLARGFKRRLGDPAPLLLGDELMTAAELTGHLLRWVVDVVTASEGGPPAHVTLTCPATWGEHHRDLLTSVAADARLVDVGLMPEPVAVAIHYATQERIEIGSTTAVYDLGGGTFDTALVLRTDRGYELRGRAGGDESIGGEDFDDVVMDHVRRSLGNALTLLDTSDEAVLAGLQQVRDNAVAAKEALSRDLDASVAVILPGVSRTVRLTRAEFESAVRIPLLRTVDALERTISAAGLQPAELQGVLLAGGSSRIPLVSELLSSELGLQVFTDSHPKYAVCMGAALAAAGRLEPVPGPDAPVERLLPTVDPAAAEAASLLAEAPEPSGLVVARPEQLGVMSPVDEPLRTAPELRRPLRHLSDKDELLVEHRSDARRAGRVVALAVVAVAVVVVAVSLAASQGLLPGSGGREPTGSASSPASTGSASTTPSPTDSSPTVGPEVVLTPLVVTGEPGDVVHAAGRTDAGVVAVGTSADDLPRVWQGSGDSWSPAPPPPLGQAGAAGVNAVAAERGHPAVAVGWSSDAGVDPAERSRRRGEAWVSGDGRAWVRAIVPDVGELADVVRLPDGSLLATGTTFAEDPSDGDPVVLRSSDGARWDALVTEGLDGPGPFELRRVVADPGGLVALGARLEGGVVRSGLWTSADGTGWTHVTWLTGTGSGVAEARGLTRSGDGQLVVVGTEGSVGATTRAVVWRGTLDDMRPRTVDVTGSRPHGVAVMDEELVVVGTQQSESEQVAAAWTLGS